MTFSIKRLPLNAGSHKTLSSKETIRAASYY
jgi:hypothetical protein